MNRERRWSIFPVFETIILQDPAYSEDDNNVAAAFDMKIVNEITRPAAFLSLNVQRLRAVDPRFNWWTAYSTAIRNDFDEEIQMTGLGIIDDKLMRREFYTGYTALSFSSFL
ncbi:hypothetical protein IFR05_003520 [Cadophora sp. M221]|nr:hypothetical protein IFR05_003520 [Cadophora sp. M221]